MTLAGFGEYSPDSAETNTSVSANLLNVMPISDPEVGVAYTPCKSLVSVASAGVISEAPYGGVSVVDRSGAYFAFVGTPTTIQRFNADYSWSILGTGYTLPINQFWSAVPFGNFALFSNTQDGLKQYDVEAGGAFTAVANSYAPGALFTAFDCVFGADCLDDAGNRDNRLLRNTDINDHTDWDNGLAGYQIFPDGEALMGGAELSNGLAVVFQKNAVRALNRTSDGSLYTVSTIALGVGAVNRTCIAAINGVAYFVDTDGFKSVSAGGIRNIGSQRVNRTFLGNLGASGFDSVTAAVDPANKRIVWRYQGASDGTGPVFSSAMAYYYEIDRFVPLSQANQFILTLATPAYDLDSMSAAYPSIDDPTMPDLDSRFWAGGEPRLFGITTDGKGGFFDGPNLAATLESGTIPLPYSGLVNSLVPITDSASATVDIAMRDVLSAGRSWSASNGISPDGRCMVRARGKYLSARLNVPAMTVWTFARGMDSIDIKPGGVR